MTFPNLPNSQWEELRNILRIDDFYDTIEDDESTESIVEKMNKWVSDRCREHKNSMQE